MAALLSGPFLICRKETGTRNATVVWLSDSLKFGANTMADEGMTGRRTSGLKASFTLWLVPTRGDTAAQRAVEEHWAKRVKTARSNYQIAESQLRRAVAGQWKWPEPEPHGSALVHAARIEKLAARNEYVRALKTFSELLLHGEGHD
jgi:hypothetical protein